MRGISCLLILGLLGGCTKPENLSTCKAHIIVEEDNANTGGVTNAISDSFISQSLRLTNRVSISRVKLRFYLSPGSPYQVWFGYGNAGSVFDTGSPIVAIFNFTSVASPNGANSPWEQWLDLPTPVVYDPLSGDLYISIVSRSLSILSTDYAPLGPSHFRVQFQTQNHIHAWQMPVLDKGISVGIEGDTDNCDGTQTGL